MKPVKSKLNPFFRRVFTRIILFKLYVLIRLLPARTHEPIANALGRLMWRASAHHRRTVLTHLRMAFKDRYSDAELEVIGVRADQNMMKNIFEFILFPIYTKDDILRMVSIEGKENIDNALDAGRGCIVVSAHFGNWELLAARLSAMGYKITAVGRDQDDGLINDIIVSLRKGKGMDVIPRGTPMFKHIVATLKSNELVGLVSDQNAGPLGLFVDFFGRPTSSFKGPGLFGVITGAAVVPIFIVREGYQKHRGIFYPPVVIEPSGDVGRDIAAIVQGFTKAIEEMVSRYPDHWLWQHKRWKTPPPGVEDSSE